jgi:hypothetical protein
MDMKRKQKTMTKTEMNKREVRVLDKATVETELALRTEGMASVLAKVERAKTVSQETMQFEFSV